MGRLLQRLLQPSHPRVADAVPVWSADEPADILKTLERRVGLRHVQVANRTELAALAPRVVCVPAAGPPALVEAIGADRYRVDFGTMQAPRSISGRALDALFPCRAVALAESVAPADELTRRIPPGTGLSAALRLVAQVLGLAMPLAMMLIVDKVVTQGAENTLIVLLLGVALLTGFQCLFNGVHALHASRRGELIAHAERHSLVTAIIGSRMGSSASMAGWEAIQSSLEGGRFTAETYPQFLADVAFATLLAGLMAAFSLPLLMVALVFLPLCLAVELWSSRHARSQGTGMSTLRQHLSARYFEAAAAAEQVHAMNLARHVSDAWRSLDADLAVLQNRLGLRRRLASLAVELLQKMSVMLIMLLGVGAVIDSAMTLGQYIAFSLLSMQLGAPVLRAAAYWRARDDHGIRSASRRGLEEHCHETRWPSGAGVSLTPGDPCALSVRDLRLPGAPPRRLPIELDLLGGNWLGITGRSGCGKTTLLRTLAGLTEHCEGEVRLNGVAVQRLDHNERARQIRLVPQHPVLFSASIAENIRLGDPAAPPEAIFLAAQVCGVTDVAQRMPDDLNSLVGSGGRELSGGERQRVALARAILSRPVLLLLDEATSAIDAAGELDLLTRLRNYLPDAAVVVVSHRTSTLTCCRQVLRLDMDQAQEAPDPRRRR